MDEKICLKVIKGKTAVWRGGVSDTKRIVCILSDILVTYAKDGWPLRVAGFLF